MAAAAGAGPLAEEGATDRPSVTFEGASGAAPVLNADFEVDTPEPGPYAFAGVPAFGKAILVNVPSYELIAFEDGVPVLRTRVIIGKPSNPTPIMETETSVVRFRPTWTPTRSMIKKGIKPGTRRGGKGNPLGYVAIRLDPGMLIYLHGTNKPHLFEKEHRALSWGCVRVDRWKELTAWVLDTDVKEVERRAFGRRTHDRPTDNIPVIIGYHTEFPNEAGEWVEHKDIYRRGKVASRARANNG